MTTKSFVEASISKFGRFKGMIPLSAFGNQIEVKNHNSKGSKFSAEYSVGDMVEVAKRNALAQNPIVPNAADVVNWVMWDTFKVAANTSIGSNFKFFIAPIGTNNKTKMDTNLEQVQRLPDPQWMNVVAIGFEFGPDMTLADILTLVNNYYQEFWVGNKDYVEGRYECFPSGSGLSGFSGAATTAAATTINNSVVTNGVPSYTNMFDLRLPSGLDLGVSSGGARVVSDGLIGVTVLQGQQFKVENNAPGGAQSTSAGGNGLRLICQLYGILSRGVQ